MSGLPFTKMHGLGNDFVIVDARPRPVEIDAGRAQAICDRRAGVGCDQLLAIEPARNGRADAFMRILNADGSESGACGNGARCVADLLMTESGRDSILLETLAGTLAATREADGRVTVDMGPARHEWHEIPLARELETTRLQLSHGELAGPVAVNVGNPHAVFFVADAEEVPLGELGPRIERDPLFPERVNVGVVQLLDPERLRVRVWERGAGITRACGSAACAAVVAAVRREIIAGRRATVVLDGGTLDIAWREDGHVLMTGPVSTVFRGEIEADLLS